MDTEPNDSSRLPGPGERIRRLAQNPVPSGGAPPEGAPSSARATFGSAVPADRAADDRRRPDQTRANAPDPRHSAANTAHAAAHPGDHGRDPHEYGAGGDAHGHHPTARLYVMIGIILTIITAVEVSAYYIPAWEGSAIYVPSMLFLSSVKFVTVVMFYMHLKYDHKLFRALFTGPFVIAFGTLFGLMFLFGKLAIRLGLLS